MINRRKRTISLSGHVNDEMYKEVVAACTGFDGGARVKLYLNTPGGYLNDGLAIHDMLKLNLPKLTIITAGTVMSAGTLIMCGADKVLSLPTTEFMIHYGEASASSLNEVRANARAHRVMRSIICNKVNVGEDVVKKWFEGETYFSATQALRVGLIDGIIGANHE